MLTGTWPPPSPRLRFGASDSCWLRGRKEGQSEQCKDKVIAGSQWQKWLPERSPSPAFSSRSHGELKEARCWGDTHTHTWMAVRVGQHHVHGPRLPLQAPKGPGKGTYSELQPRVSQPACQAALAHPSLLPPSLLKSGQLSHLMIQLCIGAAVQLHRASF